MFYDILGFELGIWWNEGLILGMVGAVFVGKNAEIIYVWGRGCFVF